MLHILDIQRDEVTEGHAEAARRLADKVTFPLQGFLLGGKATLLLVDGLARPVRYDDVERGERGSSEEHLTVTQFKVQQEQARLAEIQNQRVDVRSIEKIVATSIPFSPKVAVEREDFDRLSTLAKKYVTAEKKESKLQKALDAANKLIAKLKAEIDGLKQEISDYKSVRGKLRAAELERKNTELRGKVRSYEDVIQRNNLWRFFHPHREKAVTRDEAR